MLYLESFFGGNIMTKSKLRQAGICLICAVICFTVAGCKQEPKEEKVETRLDKIFKIFDTFAAENYSPPAGFDTETAGGARGTIEEKEYDSKTTGAKRKCMVYTPPGYQGFASDKWYPVLYLLHGIGGTHTEWTVVNAAGPPKAKEILDNLISAGKAKPMIVVMPNVRAMKNDNPPGDIYGEENVAAFHNFINDLRDDLMPFIQSKYKVSDTRDQTAIAGLSFGGLESLNIGCQMYKTFGYVGAFSAPGGSGLFPLTAEETTVPNEYKDKTFFMLCCGLQDNLALTSVRNYTQTLVDNGVRAASYEISGGHDFGVWNNGLYYFAQCIF